MNSVYRIQQGASFNLSLYIICSDRSLHSSQKLNPMPFRVIQLNSNTGTSNFALLERLLSVFVCVYERCVLHSERSSSMTA